MLDLSRRIHGTRMHACVSPTKQTVVVVLFSTRCRRLVHGRLLLMHVVAAFAQAAGVAKFKVPVSDRSCLAKHRLTLCMLILYDVSIPVKIPPLHGTHLCEKGGLRAFIGQRAPGQAFFGLSGMQVHPLLRSTRIGL